MKKQINVVSNWSVKGIFVVTVLSAMLCALGVKADNIPPADLNAVTEEMELGNKIENWMNDNTFWVGSSDMVEIESDNSADQWMVSSSLWEINNQNEEEIANEIQSWMNTSSYWSDSETSANLDVVRLIGSWITSTSYWVKGKSFCSQGN